MTMSTATQSRITDTPVWREVKNWSDDDKNALITLLYTSMDIDDYQLPEEEDEAAFVNDIPRDALRGCVEMALKDHEAGKTIPHNQLMKQIREKRGWE